MEACEGVPEAVGGDSTPATKRLADEAVENPRSEIGSVDGATGLIRKDQGVVAMEIRPNLGQRGCQPGG